MHHLKKFIAAASLCCLHAAGSAGVIFATGSDSDPLDNVVFNPCAAEISEGTTVSGCMSGNQSIYVNFTGNEVLIADGGQATISAKDGEYNFLSIQMATTTLGFTKISFNINTDRNDDVGFITFTANMFTPGGSFTSSALELEKGQNVFTVSSNGTDIIQSLSFISTTGVTSVSFEDTRQVRIGVVDTTRCPAGTTGTPPNCVPDQNNVPEPGSLALVGLALAAAGGVARRRRA